MSKTIKQKSSNSDIHKVIFVCNGNVYRSLSAECLLKHYLNIHKIEGWEIFSAGTTARKQDINPTSISKLKSLGIKKINHKQHRLNKSMLKKFDTVIAMAVDQIDFMKTKFNYTRPFLFNELARNEKSSIWDIGDNVKDYLTNPEGVTKEINKTIQHIHDNIPGLVASINKLYL